MAVSTTLITLDAGAERFDPYDRKCWLQKEIQLSHFSYKEDYRLVLIFMRVLIQYRYSHWNDLHILFRYEMSNCLVEAAIQEAYRSCECYPGYLFSSNDSCFGDSLNCFKTSLYYLGKGTIVIYANIVCQ